MGKRSEFFIIAWVGRPRGDTAEAGGEVWVNDWTGLDWVWTAKGQTSRGSRVGEGCGVAQVARAARDE